MTAALTQGEVHTTDLYQTYKHLFNDRAQWLTELPKALDAIGVEYIAFRVSEQNIPKAVIQLIDMINTHAALGHIVRFLTPLAHIQLSDNGYYNVPAEKEYVVYSFPAFTPEGSIAVKAANYSFRCEEGTVPPKAFT